MHDILRTCKTIRHKGKQSISGRLPLLLLVSGILAASANAASDEPTLLTPDKIFVVTATEKDSTHPYFGRGSKLGLAIDGSQGKELILTRGNHYAFRVETDVRHDFYLTTSSVGKGAEVLADGVKGNFTYRGTVTFSPTLSTSDIAYYQCRNHKYMGGKLHIVNRGDEDKVVFGVTDDTSSSKTEGAVITETQVKQKISFAELIINGSAAVKRIKASENDQAKTLFKKAQNHLAESRENFNKQELKASLANIDEALRLMSAASRLIPSVSQNDEQKARFAELMEGVKAFESSYRHNAAKFDKQGIKNFRRMDLDEHRQIITKVDELAEAGQYTEANRILAKAQRTITKIISEMMHQQTVVYDKNFATPVEEYKYELARYFSYEELIPIAIEQKQPSKRAVELMDQFAEKARGLQEQAATEAGNDNFADSIQMLQAATSHMQRALQIAGVR